MSRFHRFLATILMVNLTCWLVILTCCCFFFADDMVLTGRVFVITLMCAIASCLFHFMESRCVWSTDPQSKFNRRIFTEE